MTNLNPYFRKIRPTTGIVIHGSKSASLFKPLITCHYACYLDLLFELDARKMIDNLLET
jgi:hypothetical protein